MRKFDLRFKLKVVRDYLAGKGGYKILAAKYGIANSLVRSWVAAYQHHGSAGLWRDPISDLGKRENELAGKTLMVVGFGRIGQRVAALAKAFGMSVIAVKRDLTQ